MEVVPSGTSPGAQKCGSLEGAKPSHGFILARMGWKDYQSKEVIGKAERRLTPGQTGFL
jgi:hypothetical protein